MLARGHISISRQGWERHRNLVVRGVTLAACRGSRWGQIKGALEQPQGFSAEVPGCCYGQVFQKGYWGDWCRKPHVSASPWLVGSLSLHWPTAKGGWKKCCWKIGSYAESKHIEKLLGQRKTCPASCRGSPPPLHPSRVMWGPMGVLGTCTGERFLAGSMHWGHFSWRKAVPFWSARMWAKGKPSVCSAFSISPRTLQVLEMQLIMSDPFTLLEKLFIITFVLSWHLSPQ